MILAGKDRGETGTVSKVIRDEKFPRVIVEGLNLVSYYLYKLILLENHEGEDQLPIKKLSLYVVERTVMFLISLCSRFV